ncbi:MAG: DNA-directed RNA polymerase subunit D [Nanoarchaeota archaeon]|nr:DNA-directed RNA polymerase subunit D [Nanoarchaeota archaeon]MBU1030097.1 DNA-directed RNA polymerase subunit D [Nanoarchaeota archaeon]MBU1849941.1 DNA-directed RNA polymerase subunit D [Nanoarchaeota archaeon]
MDIKILSNKKDKLTFLLKGVNNAYVNTLRRYMMTEVPTLAIEEVTFKINNSILYDEIVAHRLGLIPIKTDLKSYNFTKDCKCKGKGCAQCQLKLSLKSKNSGFVYASEIKSNDAKCKPVYPKMPITKLQSKQDIEFEATAILGIGKEHMKWSPGLIFFKQNPKIKIKKDPENKQLVVERCPQSIFELKNGKLSVNSKKESDCILCSDCVDLTNNNIELEKSDEFIFTVESWGQLDPQTIVTKAIDVYNDQINEFSKLLK